MYNIFRVMIHPGTEDLRPVGHPFTRPRTFRHINISYTEVSKCSIQSKPSAYYRMRTVQVVGKFYDHASTVSVSTYSGADGVRDAVTRGLDRVSV